MPTQNNLQWGAMVPGRPGGTPGDHYNNAYNDNRNYYYGGPATVQRGLNLGVAPKPAPDPYGDPFAGLSLPAMPSLNMNNGGWNGGDGSGVLGALGLSPPAPPSPHISSSIPLQQMAGQYLPPSVVRANVNAQVGKHIQAANPQQFLEQYAGNSNNMASALSGQYMPQIMAQMQDPLQASAMAQGQIPAEAALARYQFGTQGLQAQTGEVSQLAGLANQNYSNRLQQYAQQLSQAQQGLGMLFG